MIDEILVAQVQSRPLTLDEIQTLGIQFDESSFQAFNFTLAFTTESKVVKIDLPVLTPIGRAAGNLPGFGFATGGVGVTTLESAPGLPSLSLAPVMLEPIEEIGELLPEGVEIPAIPGIVVIPGNVAFLNQFFSVLLLVSNQAPDGTPLVVTDLEAEIMLPPGPDLEVGNILRDPPFAPGDDEFDNPLRIAKTAAGRENVKDVLAAGPDGEPGTADDESVLPPQGSGRAEFLVEGAREGSHLVDIEIRGNLQGIPGRPVPLKGRAQGAVVVRDPDFAITFLHPDVVRAGERYELQVHVQNTSLVDANLVTVCLDSRNLTGARFLAQADSCELLETIAAGDSGVAIFPLEALRTGRVTASTLELQGAGGVVSGRSIRLVAGVSETGAPLSPDTLILPPVNDVLRERAGNDELFFRAVALLGQAQSIAMAPRGSLPVGVSPIPPEIVVQRGRELTEASLRLDLSVRPGPGGAAEPRPDGLLLTLQDLFFDFLGAGRADSGWDSLYRNSRQARLFAAALAEVVEQKASLLDLPEIVDLQASWARTEAYRSGHVTIATEGVGGDVPVALTVTDLSGRRLGGSLDPEAMERQIPQGDLLSFGARGQLAVLPNATSVRYTASLRGLANGSFDLGVVVPGLDGELRHLVFRSIDVAAGEDLLVTIRPRAEPPVSFQRGGVFVDRTSDVPIPDGPPEVLGIVQVADASTDVFGRVVGVLFDEDVEANSAQDASAYAVSDAAIAMVPPPALLDSNPIQSARLQFGDRIVLLGLRDPVGPFVPRFLGVTGVRDLRGQEIAPLAGASILPDPDLADGAQLTGRLLRDDGSPVPDAEVSYLQVVANDFGIPTEQVISRKLADDQGRFAFDYIRRHGPPFAIEAADVDTGDRARLGTTVAFDGERIDLDLVLIGRGTVEGTVRSASGSPIRGALVEVVSQSDLERHQANTDQNGTFVINRVAVGAFGIEASTGTDGTLTGRARGSGTLVSGGVAMVDLTIFVPEQGKQGRLSGQVRLPTGGAAGGVRALLIDGRGAFLTGVDTDEAGSFAFSNLPAGTYTVRGLDVGRSLIGEATVTLAPGAQTIVGVALQGSGSVSGRVFRPDGFTPVPGALVAGGVQVVTADAGGNYFLPVVPVGVATIEAADPVTDERGSRQAAILTNGQASTGIDIVLKGLGSVRGRVFDAVQSLVAGQEVRILIDVAPGLAGRSFQVRKATTDSHGAYRFDRLELRDYTLMVVRGNEVANGRVLLSRSLPDPILDLRTVRPTGVVAGQVVQAGEPPIGAAAQVALKAMVPNAAGILEFTDAGSMVSDPAAGFRFTNLFPGPFSVTATSFFSPGGEGASFSGSLPDFDPVKDDIVLSLVSNDGKLAGDVLRPDGTNIEILQDQGGTPLPLSVCISSSRLRSEPVQCNPALTAMCDGICADASTGRFESPISLPPDLYTVQVTDERPGSSTRDLTGQAQISLSRGQTVEQDVRLLGLGDLGVSVVDGMTNPNPVPCTEITVRRTTFPFDPIPPQAGPSALFEDLTEGPVSVTAVVSTDAAGNAGCREELRGFAGTANGIIVRGSSQMIEVVIASAGSVRGHFHAANGQTVRNAQVQLHASGRPTAFDVTTVDGEFRFVGVPVGNFTLEGFDPATGRSGMASGRLDLDRQEVIQDLALGPLGSVTGVVLNAARTAPAAGATVQLLRGGGLTQTVTAAPDGTFAFHGVPGGAFTVRGISLVGFSGEASGSIDLEGEVVEVEVELAGSARVEGRVVDASESPLGGASVTLVDVRGSPRLAQSSDDPANLGHFGFDLVPLGGFSLTARPAGAQTPGDWGEVSGLATADGEVVTTDVKLIGTITVNVEVDGVFPPDPQNQVGVVNVSLTSISRFGGNATITSQDNDTHTWTFGGVPRTAFTATATQVVGATTISASRTLLESEVRSAEDPLHLQLVLNEVATVAGRVEHPGGLSVPGTRVTLTAGPASSQLLVENDGSFKFVGVPLDVPLLKLVADAPSGDRATFRGRVDDVGRVLDEDDVPVGSLVLTLDTEPPFVVEVQPTSNAVGVPTGASVTVLFSEALDRDTLETCPGPLFSTVRTFRLLAPTNATPAQNDPNDPCDDGNVVSSSIKLSPNGRLVTLTPLEPLDDLTLHRLVVDSGPLGVRDLAGRSLESTLLSSFTTRDGTAPTVVAVSPANGALEVPVQSVVRITFSEPVAASTLGGITLTGPNGSVSVNPPAAILGGTVVVLAPTASLSTDASYTVTVDGVEDVAGNRLTSAFVSSFATPDKIAPAVTELTLSPPRPIAGQIVRLSASAPDPDVDRVEFFLNGTLVAVANQRSAAGSFEASVVMPEDRATFGARAIDRVGNVGLAGPIVMKDPVPDERPSLLITSPGPGSAASPGEILRVRVQAQDDVGVVQVRAAVSGVVTLSQVQVVAPVTGVAIDFDIPIPSDLVSGTVTFATFGTDTRGQVSTTETRDFQVQDAKAPLVSIDSPVPGEFVAPGTTIEVVVSASDAGGVAEVALAVPEAGFSQTQAISPAVGSVTRTFSVVLPDPFSGVLVTLNASATDRASNTGVKSSQLPVFGAFEFHSASSPVVSVFNEVDPSATPDPNDPAATTATSPAVSVLNLVDPATTPEVKNPNDPAATSASSPVVSVLNELDPSEEVDPGKVTNGTATAPVVTIKKNQ